MEKKQKNDEDSFHLEDIEEDILEHYEIVSEEETPIRLDVFLVNNFEEKSRAHYQKLIEEEHVTVNGIKRKSNYKVNKGDNVVLELPPPRDITLKPENIPLEIMYEDEDLIVVNKPQGMIVHPAPGVYSGTLVNALLYHCKDLSGINGVMRPGIVHRIDKDTSGVLVVAKNDFAHQGLGAQLQDHSMRRIYKALVEGVIKEESGNINKPLARHPQERIKIAVVQGGREAITHYEIIERYPHNTLIKCQLETGRTHQIRVHMCYIGHPLVGDPVYGYKKQRFKLEGQLLHAEMLGFIHPRKQCYMEFSAPLPDYFTKVLKILQNELQNI